MPHLLSDLLSGVPPVSLYYSIIKAKNPLFSVNAVNISLLLPTFAASRIFSCQVGLEMLN